MFETCLQNLEVVYKVHFMARVPLDSTQRNLARIGRVQQVTVDASTAQLLYPRHLSLQYCVNPPDNLLPRSEIPCLQHIR